MPVSLRIKGLPELIKKTNPSAYEGPIADALEQGTALMETVAKSRAIGSIVPTISKRYQVRSGNRLTTLPIGTVAVTSRHGIILSYGGRGKRSKWRDKGTLTKGWLQGVPRLKSFKAAIDALLSKAADKIEAGWRR